MIWEGAVEMMKNLLLLLSVVCVGSAFADVFDQLSPQPRFVSRGAAEPAATPEPEPSASNAWYRLTVRNGRPKCEGSAVGQRYAKATFYQLQALCATSRVPECVVTDWPATALRGLDVDSSSPDGDPIAMRTILVAAARHKLNLVVWKLTPGTNEVFEGVSDMEYKRLAYFAWKQGINLVPSVSLEKAEPETNAVAWTEQLLKLAPPVGLHYVDMRGKVPDAVRRRLAEEGRTLLADASGALRAPAPPVKPGKVDLLPPDLVRRLWHGAGKGE